MRSTFEQAKAQSVMLTKSAMHWGERCQPSVIIDIFWHSHSAWHLPPIYILLPLIDSLCIPCSLFAAVLHPAAYNEACVALLGNSIIDHDPEYVSPKLHAGSELVPKLRSLFKYEERWPQHGSMSSTMIKKFRIPAMYDEVYESLFHEDNCG